MIYLDTSAAIKLVRSEDHSDALRAWLEGHDGPLLSSALVGVELIRATRRSCPDRLGRAADVLDSISTTRISVEILVRAGGYPDPLLRPLGAIHLATAEWLGRALGQPVTGFVAYDGRVLEAAGAVGLPTVAPGLGAAQATKTQKGWPAGSA